MLPRPSAGCQTRLPALFSTTPSGNRSIVEGYEGLVWPRAYPDRQEATNNNVTELGYGLGVPAQLMILLVAVLLPFELFAS